MASEETDRAPREVKNHMLFEIATEVAHRVGGIYSVIKSKAPVTTAEYGDRYTLIGPLNHHSVRNCSDPIELTFPSQR
jgi:glycogen(starch) synthase